MSDYLRLSLGRQKICAKAFSLESTALAIQSEPIRNVESLHAKKHHTRMKETS